MRTKDYKGISVLANKIRIHATQMIHKAKSSHLGSNLSMAELIASLYTSFLNISPQTIDDPQRDRFILSKGHAAAGYYALLAELGFFSLEWLDKFYLNGSKLAGHITHNIPGVEVSSGALGHGLSIATGMALAGKIDNYKYRVVSLLSDGECDEGSTWESAMFSAHHKLDNLLAIIDYNKIQAMGHTHEVLDLEPFADKWKAFGWQVREIDGHSIPAILDCLSEVRSNQEKKPFCIIAHTVKGKGVSFMEDDVLWHYRNPQGDEYQNALHELEQKL